jgi:DNA repair protein RecO
MNRTHRLDGIVLKRFDLNEADRVLTVFTHEEGKVSVLAKGVKRVVSRKAGSVEVGTHSILFVAHGANFYILSEVQVKDSYQRLKSNLAILKYGYYILELIDKLIPEAEPHHDIYKLVLEIFSLLDDQPRKLYVRAFEMKLLNRLGYLTVRQQELDSGAIAGAEYLSVLASEVLEELQNGSWQHISELEVDEDTSERLRLFMQHRIRLVAEREIKSLGYFE